MCPIREQNSVLFFCFVSNVEMHCMASAIRVFEKHWGGKGIWENVLGLYSYYKGCLKKSGSSKFLAFCVIDLLVLVSSNKYIFCFYKIEFIPVILSIIDLLISKLFLS